MSDRTDVSLSKEPRGVVYRNLIDYALTTCTTFSLVKVVEMTTPEVERILELLEPFGITVVRSAEWPGTKLCYGHTAAVYRYAFSDESARVLKTEVAGLYDWSQPDRLEDLALLRDDGDPWLGSTSHEQWSWLRLSEVEALSLRRAIPEMRDYIQQICG